MFMIDSLFIFTAKYLIILSPVLALRYWYSSNQTTRREFALFALISLPLTYITGLILRQLWFDPRPFVVNKFTPLIAHAADNGFPSDHALLAGALAALMLYFNRRVSVWLWLIATAIGVARVYVGVHHIVDIAASLVIALGCALITRAIISKLWNKPNPTNS